MQIIKSKSQLKKYRLLWEKKIIEGMPFVHDDHLAGNLTFPCFISSYMAENNGLWTFHHLYFTAENAKTLLNQCDKKTKKSFRKMMQKAECCDCLCHVRD